MQKDKVNDPLVIVPISAFKTVSATWLKHFNHNHQRMTRIIRSLRILGLEEDAQAFATALQLVCRDNPGKIGEKSLLYWARVATRPLYFAPDDIDDRNNRKGFLYEYEQGQQKKTDIRETEPRDTIICYHPDVNRTMALKKTHSKDETKTKTNITTKTKEENKPLPEDKSKKNGTTKTKAKPVEKQIKETTNLTGGRRKKVKKDGAKRAKVQKPQKAKPPLARPTRTQPRRSNKKDVGYKT